MDYLAHGYLDPKHDRSRAMDVAVAPSLGTAVLSWRRWKTARDGVR